MEVLSSFLIAATTDHEVILLDRWLIVIGILQAFIFLLQLFVFRDQARKLRQTVDAAAEQSRDTKESIKQATRAAAAMEEFAKSAASQAYALGEQVATTKDTMPRLLRAYVCVNPNVS
jgi:hypothetical protein